MSGVVGMVKSGTSSNFFGRLGFKTFDKRRVSPGRTNFPFAQLQEFAENEHRKDCCYFTKFSSYLDVNRPEKDI